MTGASGHLSKPKSRRLTLITPIMLNSAWVSTGHGSMNSTVPAKLVARKCRSVSSAGRSKREGLVPAKLLVSRPSCLFVLLLMQAVLLLLNKSPVFFSHIASVPIKYVGNVALDTPTSSLLLLPLYIFGDTPRTGFFAAGPGLSTLIPGRVGPNLNMGPIDTRTDSHVHGVEDVETNEVHKRTYMHCDVIGWC